MSKSSDEPTTGNPTGENETPRDLTKPKRLRRMRLIAVLFPFFIVGLLELVFRLTGLYENPDHKLRARQVKELPTGTNFFPAWDVNLVVPKPADTRRVFVLGGSSAMGFGVDRPFSTVLESSLAKAAPTKKWEVVNGAVSAYGSQRVLAILERACEFNPDAIIVYLGHNEFLEDVFYDPDGMIGRLERATSFARRFRVVNFVTSLLPRKKANPEQKPKLQQHFFGNSKFPLIHSGEEKAARIAFLQKNLRAMAAHCRKQGVRLILIPAATNLLSPPGDPQHGWETEDYTWSIVLSDAEAAMSQRDYATVDRLSRQLLEMDPDHAAGHYLAGLSALGLEQSARGEAELTQSSRLDWRGDRAGPDLQQAILNAAREEGVTSLDVRRSFAKRLQADFRLVAGGGQLSMFLDHCHPSQIGHELIAERCLPILLDLLGEAKE